MRLFSDRPKWQTGAWANVVVAATLITATSSSSLSAQAKEPTDRSSAVPSREIITRLIDAGQFEEAQGRLKQELSKTGETEDTLFLEALILFKQKHYEESMEKLKRSLALSQNDPEVHKLLAMNAVVLNQLDVAEPALKTAAQLAPNDYMVHLHLGLLYFTTNRFSLAENEFDNLIRLNPTYMKGYDLLGQAQEELQSEEVVTRTYRKAIELADQQHLHDESPYLHLSKFLWQKNRFEESLPLAQRATELNPNSAEAYCMLGRILDKLGQTEPAVKALQRSIQVDPKYAEAHYLLSRILLKQGKQEEAEKEMQDFREARKSSK
jgi:tetratricopeptide (TPR) repeat protein